MTKRGRWTNLLRCVSSNSRIVSPNSSTSVIGTTGSSPSGDQLCTNDLNCIDVCSEDVLDGMIIMAIWLVLILARMVITTRVTETRHHCKSKQWCIKNTCKLSTSWQPSTLRAGPDRSVLLYYRGGSLTHTCPCTLVL